MTSIGRSACASTPLIAASAYAGTSHAVWNATTGLAKISATHAYPSAPSANRSGATGGSAKCRSSQTSVAKMPAMVKSVLTDPSYEPVNTTDERNI